MGAHAGRSSRARALEVTRKLIDRSADSSLEVSLELEQLAQGMLSMADDAYHHQAT